ncbi:MAG: hypothetical protein K2O18_05695 [Oscillospiraceae bacterium]|nr:hypothetical protein [Oscillospiraceae bacterium]
MNENPEKLRKFTLPVNSYLKRKTDCYFILNYLRYGVPGNPEFILTLKNTFNSESVDNLRRAKNRVVELLTKHTPYVMKNAGISCCTMVCVPRAKEFDTYTKNQMYLLDGVSEAARQLSNVTDGTGAIVRTVSTKTTHFRKPVERVTSNGEREANTGKDPYPGITKDTCKIDTEAIRGKTILLVDDIYTAGVNIDEDCIQALYNAGAEKVVLFTLSYTTV